MSDSGAGPTPWPSSELWDFSLRVYARPRVEAACLGLQRRHRLDVNLLLAACWAGASGRGVLSAARWQALHARTAVWQGEIVGALRTVRRRLKTAEAGELGKRLRGAVLACELDAEHIEQLMIEGELAAAAAAAVRTEQRPTDAARNLMRLFETGGCAARHDADRADLAALLRACFPETDPGTIQAALERAGFHASRD